MNTEFLIKREMNKVILENLTMFPPYIFGNLENSQSVVLLPAHKAVYDISPPEIQGFLDRQDHNKIESGDLGYSFAIVDRLEKVLEGQYEVDPSDMRKLIDKLYTLVRTPVFDKTQRKVTGNIIYSEIRKIGKIKGNNKMYPLIYNTIFEILREERLIAERYYNASSTYVQHLDNSLYLAYIYKKMLLATDLNGDDVSNKDGYIYKTLSKLADYDEYIKHADIFLFTILPLGQLLDPSITDRRVIHPDFDYELIDLNSLQDILEIEKDYLLSEVESNISDIIYDFTGADGLLPPTPERSTTSPLLHAFTSNLEGLLNPRIIENTVKLMNNGVVYDNISCNRKDMFVIINAVMGPYCKKILDNKGSISYRTHTIKDQKGGEVVLMELNKREGLDENTYVYVVCAMTRNDKQVNRSMVLSLVQIHKNGRTPKLSGLASQDDTLSVKMNVKNLHHTIAITHPTEVAALESVSGSVYLDEENSRFRYSKKIKYDDAHKEFSNVLFYLKTARRSGNITQMKSLSISLMDLLLYTEAYIYDDKTKKDDTETKKYIALRANVISELQKTLDDIANNDAKFNFYEYYKAESKQSRSVSIESFVRAAFSLAGELINATAGLLRKPFI